MGQRHQLYVVARINGRYERIVALHHQWYYGKAVLEGALRFLKACQHPFNVHSIRAELNAVDFSKGPDEYEDKTLCPFIAALLWGTIASFSIKSAPSTDNPIRMNAPANYDNNDGISVFDITNPCEPRYCFVNVCHLEARRPVKIFWPFCGETYVRAYYPTGEEPLDETKAKWEEQVVAVIESIKEYKTISYATLKACWPDDYREDVPDNQPDGMGCVPLQEGHILPSLSHYAITRLQYAEWSHIPEHIFKACSRFHQFPSTFIQRLMLAAGEGTGGVLDLTDIPMTLSDVIQVAKDIPILAQNTLYLDLSMWINPNGGLLNVSDLVALGSCFPRLLCLNAIGNGHFDSTLLSEWYECDTASFSVLWYATRTEVKGAKSSCFTMADLYDIKASNPLPFGILLVIHNWRSGPKVKYLGQPFILHPPVLLHCIHGVLTAMQCLQEYIRYDESVWHIKTILSTVDDSAIPVMMPAVGTVNPTSPPTGWTLVLDAPEHVPIPTRYAFVYCAGADDECEVMGLDGFLSSPNNNVIEEDWKAIVSDLRSKFDAINLLSENEVNQFFAPNTDSRSFWDLF